MILANTLFQCVCYHPEEFQIITSGTDRKVSTPARGKSFLVQEKSSEVLWPRVQVVRSSHASSNYGVAVGEPCHLGNAM